MSNFFCGRADCRANTRLECSALVKKNPITGEGLDRRMKQYEPQFDSPTLSRIENGKVLPTPETLRHLAEILGVETWGLISPQYLM